MLASREDILPLLQCPKSGAPLRVDGDRLRAEGESRSYDVVNGVPLVIDFDNSVLSEEKTLAQAAKSVVVRRVYSGPRKVIKHLLSPPKKATRKNVAALIGDLCERNSQANVLVIGGGSIGQGMGPLYDHPTIKVFAFDIYASPTVQLVADGHQIPLADKSFDAVVIQAVLEHTLQPAEVVAEIWRVLKDDGLVYAETPFMQQVHEGAYDFTRFSESGHRYLFRNFSSISSGVSSGPGRQLMWSVDYLARGLFRSRLAGKVAKLAFFWANYLDYVIPEAYASDGASGVFFYGRKSTTQLGPDDIIAYYKGAQ